MPFPALHLSPQILQAVRDSGYTEPTPIQVAAIPLISAGHDIIGIAQTGTGKTAAFVLPILMKLAASKPNGQTRGTRALVVAPTRELVVQIEENVRAYAKHVPLRMATVFGGVSESPQIQALRSGVDLVVATPGRLIDLMDQRVANLSGIEFLVLDEADRMLDMGFLPPIRRIVKALPQKRQTLMFSASLSREIEKLTHEFQMQSEDYVHRIGRTGRAHAVGDAISFITPEDQGPLRSLERFIGRGIVRKKAEGFDYNQAAPPRDERGRGARVPQRKIEPRLPGNSPRGSGDAPQGQIGWRFRNASSNNRPPRISYRRHR